MLYDGCKGELQFDDEHHICPLRSICLRYVDQEEKSLNFFVEDQEEDCDMFMNITLIKNET